MSALGFVKVPTMDGDGTEIIRYDAFVALLFKQEEFRNMADHARAGVCEEAGELSDVLKKTLVYGRELNRDRVLEEMGGIRFYLQAVMNLYGINEQEILQFNADQLSTRYSEMRYSNEAAQTRADKNVDRFKD